MKSNITIDVGGKTEADEKTTKKAQSSIIISHWPPPSLVLLKCFTHQSQAIISTDPALQLVSMFIDT
jgi:hypothetical protein